MRITNNSEFRQYLNNESIKYKESFFPIRVSWLERRFTKKVKCNKLHPNPYDEFSMPEIGPNWEIISGYAAEYRNVKGDFSVALFSKNPAFVPLQVQKIHPDGYMILNGHHRWAAALRTGIQVLPVEVINLTPSSDIKKMLGKATRDKRVAMDLDEVILCMEDGDEAEKELRFPFNRLYPQKLRKGIPALFYCLNNLGYDIWIYSAKYYSMDQIQHLFRHYHAKVAGIVTGTGRKGPQSYDIKENLKKLLSQKYKVTIHIDRHTVQRIDKELGKIEEINIGSSMSWSGEVIEIMKKVKDA